ncbi:hypothetical protein K438DRAFT_1755992 [Mycena galopus ATCC 62051]|nr:hypothetical protein K438DRAFT_1755992 [Mycena galopus ATCC 62051]
MPAPRSISGWAGRPFSPHLMLVGDSLPLRLTHPGTVLPLCSISPLLHLRSPSKMKLARQNAVVPKISRSNSEAAANSEGAIAASIQDTTIAYRQAEYQSYKAPYDEQNLSMKADID